MEHIIKHLPINLWKGGGTDFGQDLIKNKNQMVSISVGTELPLFKSDKCIFFLNKKKNQNKKINQRTTLKVRNKKS